MPAARAFCVAPGIRHCTVCNFVQFCDQNQDSASTFVCSIRRGWLRPGLRLRARWDPLHLGFAKCLFGRGESDPYGPNVKNAINPPIRLPGSRSFRRSSRWLSSPANLTDQSKRMARRDPDSRRKRSQNCEWLSLVPAARVFCMGFGIRHCTVCNFV